MTKKKIATFRTVRILTISEIVQLWSQEINVPASTIERELKASIINLPRLAEGKPLIEEFPSEDSLPPSDARLSKSHIGLFAEKQGWPKPRFWFGEVHEQSFPGRPSISRALVQELERLDAVGQRSSTIAEQSRILARWASDNFRSDQVPSVKGLENLLRDRFNELKRAT